MLGVFSPVYPSGSLSVCLLFNLFIYFMGGTNHMFVLFYLIHLILFM